MDSGRAEAARNLAIAERLLAALDLVGSKRFAELALAHDPLLDGIDHVLAVADVLLASQTHPDNPFAVLGVDPSSALSDPSAAPRHYRRLALLLRPDRNSLPSAPLAFKLLSDAFAAVSAATEKNQSAFWTACPACCHAHQYARECLDRNLRCPSCSRTFRAAELPTAPPIVPGTESYYCSWAFFPIGFPTSPSDPDWKPFIPFFPPSSGPNSQNPNSNEPNPEKNGDGAAGGGARQGRSKKVARKRVGGNLRKKVLSSEANKAAGININEMAGGGSEGKETAVQDVEYHIDLDATVELLGNLQNLPFLN